MDRLDRWPFCKVYVLAIRIPHYKPSFFGPEGL
jgi:hypothetical protein